MAAVAPADPLAGAVLTSDRVLPVIPELASLLPAQGLVRGSTVACAGEAAMSLALALVAGASRAGAWVGAVGTPGLGIAAAAELGVGLHRLVAVLAPARGFDDATWAQVLAAMIDGFDIVLLGLAANQVRAATARRIQARAQARGAVLVTLAPLEVFGSDLVLQSAGWEWEGLGAGHGRLTRRRVAVVVDGRRVPRPQRGELWLPDGDGTPGPVAPVSSVAAQEDLRAAG
jgi:hypothetical protein